MDIKHTSQAMNDLFHKGAANKNMINCFSLNFTKTTSVRAEPTPLVQVIPSAYFPINSQPSKAFQFLWDVEAPNHREDTIF